MTIHWKPWCAAALTFTALIAEAPLVLAQDSNLPAPGARSAAAELPAWIRRGLPGAGHAAIAPLVGTWHVQMGIYGTLGRRDDEPPITSDDIVARREWVAGGRYLEDTTEGSLEGARYWRRGWLGYSNMDRRYEWVTIDAVNSEMMSYASSTGSGPQTAISLTGVFTDQGVAGEAYAGKSIPMRTVIRIESNDRHTIELYFTRPGDKERLATRAVYTRTAP
ncbi:DUF1579 family protein [Collimonas sp. H4R21]|jgi:hypothetical protein|uniref:DUF1579 family protein n=1 Tax=Collimonas rhizosphaerae TaxID=3126357 RepID=A0ABU9PV60_9BURK